MKICLVCLAQLPDSTRADAKVCSVLCRKRLQRAREKVKKEYPQLADSDRALRVQLSIEGWQGDKTYYLEADQWPV